MTYRLQISNADGIIRGYQNVETLDPDTFAAIVTGQRPLGNEDAQYYDQPVANAAFTGLPCYYTHVFNMHTLEYITDADPADVDRLYQECYAEGELP